MDVLASAGQDGGTAQRGEKAKACAGGDDEACIDPNKATIDAGPAPNKQKRNGRANAKGKSSVKKVADLPFANMFEAEILVFRLDNLPLIISPCGRLLLISPR